MQVPLGRDACPPRVARPRTSPGLARAGREVAVGRGASESAGRFGVGGLGVRSVAKFDSSTVCQKFRSTGGEQRIAKAKLCERGPLRELL